MAGGHLPSTTDYSPPTTHHSPLLSPQPLQQLNLPRVRQVVCRDSRNQCRIGRPAAAGPVGQFTRRQLRDGAAQRPMLLLQECYVVPPHLFWKRLGQSKPIAALERKGPALVAAKPAAHGVLPVRGVDDDISDAAPPGIRTQARLGRRQAANRTAQVRPMPGFFLIRLVEELQEQLDLGRNASRTLHGILPHGGNPQATLDDSLRAVY